MNRPTPPPVAAMVSPPFQVRAIYKYGASHEDDLEFPIGQIIKVTEADEEDWYTGEFVDENGHKHEGIFPRNFVEQYEPPTPPRPSRPRPKKEATQVRPEETPPSTSTKSIEPVVPIASQQVQSVAEKADEERTNPRPKNAADAPGPEAPQAAGALSLPSAAEKTESSHTPAKVDAGRASKPPPPEKPASGSFKDRIAAFNKSSAPPPVPFKPAGSGAAAYINKPFVAPPPSRNAYIPPLVNEPPVKKIYRREEDPELNDQTHPDAQENMSSSLPTAGDGRIVDEDQPKPTSLKERIALLQKQQLEAQTRAVEGGGRRGPHNKAASPAIERRGSADEPHDEQQGDEAENTVSRRSLETARQEASRTRSQIRSPLQPSISEEGGEAEEDHEGLDTHLSSDTYDQPTENTIEPGQAKSARATRVSQLVHSPPIGEDTEPEAEDEELDPEVRRKLELRQRMAKMSGGMGMPGMFALPSIGSGAGPSRKSSGPRPMQPTEDDQVADAIAPASAPPIPGSVRALPSRPQSSVHRQGHGDEAELEQVPEESGAAVRDLDSEAIPDKEDVFDEVPPTKSPKQAPVNIPAAGGRALPPLPGQNSRLPPPLPPTSPPQGPFTVPSSEEPRAPSPSAGEESDDEMSFAQGPSGTDTATDSGVESRQGLGVQGLPSRTTSRKKSQLNRSAFQDDYSSSASSSVALPARRPPAGSGIGSDASVRPVRGVPPLPPSTPPRMHPAPGPSAEESEEEYEGDYDTDIAPTASHKPALKFQESIQDGDDDDSLLSSAPPPPLPPSLLSHKQSPQLPSRKDSGSRAVPPPPPSQPPVRSVEDTSRAPPPVPQADLYHAGDSNPTGHSRDESYDPYRYDRTPPSGPLQAPVRSMPPPPPSGQPRDGTDPEDTDFTPEAPPVPTNAPPSITTVPAAISAPETTLAPRAMDFQSSSNRQSMSGARQSLDVGRQPSTRRSIDPASRPSVDYSGQHAVDVELSPGSMWYTQPNTPPPVYKGRPGKDILYEMEDSTSSKRGGKTINERNIYVLFPDYSQTIITARHDAANPSDVHFEQRHESPPPTMRQDRLEAASSQYGAVLAQLCTQASGHAALGEGDPHSLILSLLSSATAQHPQQFRNVLPPVGTRSYGASVYANRANASVTSADEIRAGDIVTFRNARFQGHRGGVMHQKYALDLGPQHVALVLEWDGSKKKVRVWEQGREELGGTGSKGAKKGGKVGEESYRLGDLRSGEVRVWRVVGREWVGWDTGS